MTGADFKSSTLLLHEPYVHVTRHANTITVFAVWKWSPGNEVRHNFILYDLGLSIKDNRLDKRLGPNGHVLQTVPLQGRKLHLKTWVVFIARTCDMDCWTCTPHAGPDPACNNGKGRRGLSLRYYPKRMLYCYNPGSDFSNIL